MPMQTYVPIQKETLLSHVTEMRANGYVLSQISVTKKDSFDLLYSFEKDYELINLRLSLDDGEEIESVGGIYPYAFLYENEMKDLFGVQIKHMRIDFGGTLYKTAVKTPFNPQDEPKEDGANG